jgi:hypothetical protein
MKATARRAARGFISHDALDRLPEIAAPTLVLAGEIDIITPPRHGRAVAESIPGARFEVGRGVRLVPSAASGGGALELALQPVQEKIQPKEELGLSSDRLGQLGSSFLLRRVLIIR